MPVDPADVDRITAGVTAIYRDGEMALGSLIAQHLRAGNGTGPDWAVERMAASSALRRASELIANRLRNRGAAAAREAMAAAYRTGGQAALEELPRERRIEARAAREARNVIPGTDVVESLASALVRDIGDRSNNVLRDVQDAYRGVITGAVARMTTTNATRLEASQQAWQALVDRGITGFTDRAGRRWELSTYVEMATRTVAQRAAVQGQTDRLAELGVDLVQVSNAPQECELCRPFEGKILARDTGGPVGKVKVEHAIDDDKQVTVDVLTTLPIARSRGLFHPQCRHSIKAHLPGVTKPEPQPTADPEGDKARQKQRAIERAIRKAKQQEQLALTPEAKKAWGAKVRERQAAMRDHLKANPDLLRQSHREQPGAGNLGRGVAAPALEAPQTPAKKAAPKKAAPPAAPTAAAPAPVKAAPAKAAPAAAKKAPKKAAKAAPRATGTPAQQRLQAGIASGVRDRQTLSGGQVARTELVTFNDGTRAVFKQTRDFDGNTAREQQDAEEMASLVLQAFGIRAPAVHRASARQIYMEYADGETGEEWLMSGRRMDVNSDQGRILGLADQVMQNYDRNGGNWLVNDGRIVPIDHGLAFSFLRVAPDAPVLAGFNTFAKHFSKPWPATDEWGPNDISPADIATMRERLAALRPEFERVGRAGWHDGMMNRLDIIGQHATGTRDRL